MSGVATSGGAAALCHIIEPTPIYTYYQQLLCCMRLGPVTSVHRPTILLHRTVSLWCTTEPVLYTTLSLYGPYILAIEQQSSHIITASIQTL